MIDHGSRSTWGPVPSRSRLWIQKCDLPPLKTGVPYNFCFIKFSPNQTDEAAEAHQTLFRPPLTPGVGVCRRIPATNLSPIEKYPHAKFHWDRSRGLDFYSRHTPTHWLLYIRCWKIIIVWCYDGVMKAWWCSDVMIWLRDDVMLWWCCVVITVSPWIHVFLVHSTLINFLIGALTQPPSQ